MNRFYQPSSPRYTSQFIENPLPMDLMMKAGEQKYNQQMQFAQTVGEMSALNANLTPGYRTEKIAPKVISDWDKKINETVQKIGSNYDSPQAIMELSKLHSQWSSDPRVQLIKYDREVGNKEWDKMLEKTDTYMTDINKNIDPKTGSLYQFGESDSYKPYTPLIKTQDTYKHWIDEFKTIEPTVQEQPVISYGTDPNGVKYRRVQNVRVETRDRNMLLEKAMEITKRIMNPTDQFSLFHKENLERELGHEPSAEEIYNSILPVVNAAQVYKQTGETHLSDEPESVQTGKGLFSSGDGGSWNTELSKRPSMQNTVSRQEIRQLKIDEWFKEGQNARSLIKQNSSMSAIYDNLLHSNPAIATMDEKSLKKEFKDYIKRKNDEAITYKFDAAKNEKEQNEWNTSISGGINEKGIMKEHGKATILRGATVINTDTGEVLQNVSDKEGLVKQGKSFNVLGKANFNDVGKQPLPGLLFIEAGSKGSEHRYGVQNPEEAEKQKPIWDLYGYQREQMTGISPVFAINFDPNKPMGGDYVDISDAGTNGSDLNVRANAENGLYFVTQQNADGKIKLKVFAANPKNPTGQADEKHPDHNTGVYDNNSPYFIKEYDIDNYGSNLLNTLSNGVMADLETKSNNNLFKIKNDILLKSLNQ